MDTSRCARCEKERPVEEFHRTSDTVHGYCKKCRREYNREWYRRNKERHVSGVMENNARYRERNRKVVERLKDVPCADCGGRFPPIAMDFDHTDDDKSWDISYLMLSGAAVETILEEAAKCEVVCSNCHRVRTANRRAKSA